MQSFLKVSKRYIVTWIAFQEWRFVLAPSASHITWLENRTFHVASCWAMLRSAAGYGNVNAAEFCRILGGTFTPTPVFHASISSIWSGICWIMLNLLIFAVCFAFHSPSCAWHWSKWSTFGCQETWRRWGTLWHLNRKCAGENWRLKWLIDA